MLKGDEIKKYKCRAVVFNFLVNQRNYINHMPIVYVYQNEQHILLTKHHTEIGKHEILFLFQILCL